MANYTNGGISFNIDMTSTDTVKLSGLAWGY